MARRLRMPDMGGHCLPLGGWCLGPTLGMNGTHGVSHCSRAGVDGGALVLRRRFLLIVVVALVVGGCSQSDDATSDETTTTTTTTTVAPTTTTTTAPTTTAAPTTTTTVDTTVETGEEWDLVWISDSIGAGVAEAWVDRIEESEGVEVRLHNYIIGFLDVENTRLMVTDESVAAQGRVKSYEGIRDELADAEIIVVYGNAAYTVPSDVATCARTGTDPRDAPNVYTSADFVPYGDVYREIYDTVFELRSGQPTVIRTFDLFAGPLADWREAGIEPECTAAWEAQADAIHEAADEYGVLTASFYDEFNGTNHDEDASEKGYI